MTSRGNLRDKLEYSFKLYDADGNGYLDKFELKQVLDAMLILLDVDKSKGDSDSIANECIRILDVDKDGKITKGLIVAKKI